MNQVGPIGVYNPNTQSIGGGVNNGASAPPPPAPLSAWAMNEGTGLVLNDSSGNANTANINLAASVTWQSNAGFPGTTPLWNGSGWASSSSSSLTNFTGTTPFTVSLWLKTTTSGVEQGLLSTLNSSGAFQGWEVEMGAAGSATFFLVNNYPSNALQIGGTTLINTGGLVNLVVTYDGSQTPAGVKIYVNGVLDTMVTAVNTLTASAVSGQPIQFGRRFGDGNQLTGVMAFVEIYAAVLSAATVASLYALGPRIN